MFDQSLAQRIRVYHDPSDSAYFLVVGQIIVGHALERARQEHIATRVRDTVDGWLRVAYSRYSAELRERLGWPCGIGPDRTMEEIVQLSKDLDQAHASLMTAQQQIEVLETERSKAMDGMMLYRDKLRSIAESTMDPASRLLAQSVFL